MSASRHVKILLGRVAGAHGVRGDVLVQSYAGTPEAIASYGALSDESGARSFELKVIRTTPKGVIGHIRGVDDRTAAEALKGTALYVDRDRLPETSDQEFYLQDLIGLTAVSPRGTAVGEVIDVQNYGAGDLLEIRLGDEQTELIPFTPAFVPEVDIPGGKIVVIPPAFAEDEEA